MPFTDFMFENIPCGCLSYYADGTIISINQALLNWLGLTKEEVLNKKRFTDLLSIGGRLYYQMVLMPLLAREGSVNEINFDMILKGGTYMPALFNAVTVTHPQHQQEIVNAVVIKITDRKKHESELLQAKRQAEEGTKRFETLCNVIPNIIWTALPNGRVNFVNNRFFKEFPIRRQGYSSTSLLSLFHLSDHTNLLRNWKRCLLTGRNFEMEMRIQSSSGAYTWYLVRAVPYMDDGGNITLWFGSCTNIHKHKQNQLKAVAHLNASLTKASEKINDRDRTLQEISYSQSHLVRKPLANILGLVQMMNTDDAEEMRNLQILLKQSAEELDEVVKSMIITV
ncbi:PAS domain-containing protein [Mucilaginibacter lacusdianchii]|uniref:PAS domain-containing protein n=1 Tax=Mucilaginibacter lacusdianchii TaxID=2684211 RepID=UPI00131CE17B|nr:PAS domain-containing protein [Mucilaginibacter sp. JXJ CY 39]